MTKPGFRGFFALIFLAALVFRLVDLGLRPMHHDEANQALKFGALLEEGSYRYDKSDHHGPSLYYLSLPFVRVLGEKTLAALDESTLRLVTAWFGLGTLLLLLFFLPAMGRGAVFWSALSLAFSPAVIYFSRFYIQETVLVFFLVGFMASVWRYLLRPSWVWATASGFFAGMMYATKETSVISFTSVGAAVLLTLIIGKKRGKSGRRGKKAKTPNGETQETAPGQDQEGGPSDGSIKNGNRGIPRKSLTRISWLHGLTAAGVALAVAVVLFTSFFQNSQGFLDSLVSFKIYFVRAGEANFHLQPFYYYLKMLVFSKSKSGPMWSEGLIVILAIAGSVAAFRTRKSSLPDRSFLRFIFFFTLISTAAYSLIPYKTPWNLLPFYAGFIILAGGGADTVLRALPKKYWLIFIFLLLALGYFHLGVESYRANFVYPADPRNPYVYAQTSPDFLKLVQRVGDIAFIHSEGRNMLIKVIAGPYETWPLPWYLREYSRVGYWQEAGEAGDLKDTAVIISSAEEALKLESSLEDTHRSEYYGLRPGVLLALHIREDLWEVYFKVEPQR